MRLVAVLLLFWTITFQWICCYCFFLALLLPGSS